jgi:N-acetylneuraminic acid mutarotase
MALSPGATIGAHRLIERLAPIGPCEVWRAYDAVGERRVVFRFFPQRWHGSPEYLQRFSHEAPALRRLNHPNILTVLDYGEYDGRTYLVAPLLSGLSLDYLLGKPWPAVEALLVLDPLASALDYAHARRVVHGNLEPPNVFVTDAGSVLLDGLGQGWGLEQQLQDTERRLHTELLPRRRPSQVAPEMLAGRPATQFSDVYALGAIAFELLTGRQPFEQEIWPIELEARADWARSRPSTLPADLPEPIVALLHQALAERPEDRLRSAGLLADRLATIVLPIQIPSRASPGQPTSPRPAPRPAPRPKSVEVEVEEARPVRESAWRQRPSRRKAGGVVAALLAVGLAYLLFVQPALVLLAGRGDHAAAQLNGGEVLIAGGCSNPPPAGSVAAALLAWRSVGARHFEPGLLDSSALYTPAGWRAAGRLAQPRCHPQALRLPNGQVLLVGGNTPGTPPVISAERFDLSSSSWYAAGKLLIPRVEYALTDLVNGQALVVGGANLANNGNEPLASAERYSPSSNSWSLAASLLEARKQHSASLLSNGEVLVVGGVGSKGISLAGAERYDPAKNAWSPAGYLSQARARHTATVLANGQVLVVGGAAERSRLASVERFDPTSGTWTRAAPLLEARAGHTATLLLDGKVLVVAGGGPSGDSATVERYDPVSNTWSPAGLLPRPRTGHTATLLPNGQVLIVGGRNEGPELPFLPTADLYDPEQNRWSSAPGLP